MKSVLIVEDYKDTREWLSRVLAKAFEQVDITTASTLEAAQKYIRQENFNLALVDINLPDGNGTELIRELTEKFPSTYRIVITIFDDDQHIFSALQAGAHGYLLKDQSEELLVDLLQGILNGQPPISHAVARRILQYFHRQGIDERRANLTGREEEVLILVAKGFTRQEISSHLKISANTTSGYIKNIYQKLNISSRAEATIEAARLGLVSLISD